jgi:hypothetical protein
MWHVWLEEKCIQGFDGEPEGQKTLRSPRRRWENNIKTDLKVTAWEGVDWINLAHYMNKWQDLVNTVMNLRVL